MSIIRYKLVIRDTRRSIYAEGKFSLYYTKNKVVKAESGTFGIMVFDTEPNAEAFAHRCSIPRQGISILRVKPLGKGKRPKYISKGFGMDRLKEFYEFYSTKKFASLKDSFISVEPPTGTMCYKAVKVLN